MKNQKGFIQIPILVTIIVGALILGSGGYVGVKQYKGTLQEKQAREEQEKIKLENEKLKESELDALKREVDTLKNKPAQIIVKEKTIEKNIIGTNANSISAEEIAPYLGGVVQITCGLTTGQCEKDGKKVACGQSKTFGSGSLLNNPNFGGFVVLTNNHVVTENRCSIHAEDNSNLKGRTGMLPHILKIERTVLNPYTDIGLFKIHQDEGIPGGNSYTPADLEYKIGDLPTCKSKMSIGSPVVVVGFPAFGVIEDSYNQGNTGTWSLRENKLVTNGIISGYDDSIDPLPYPNYFISAKTDSGNSGGIAFSKDLNGLCTLGVPTWLTLGNYETQGLVQNIHNIFYEKK